VTEFGLYRISGGMLNESGYNLLIKKQGEDAKKMLTLVIETAHTCQPIYLLKAKQIIKKGTAKHNYSTNPFDNKHHF